MKKMTNQEKVNYAAAEKFLTNKGLRIITTHRQSLNNTIGVEDPLTGRIFAITQPGYIRTYVEACYYWDKSTKFLRTYQLNPRNTQSPIGYISSRVTFPNEWAYMSTLLWKSILRIRKKAGF